MIPDKVAVIAKKTTPDLEVQRAFYEQRWQEYAFANFLKLARCVAILEGIAATKLYQPKILDLGCGTGWLSSVVGNFGPTTAVDLSSTAVENAAIKHPHVQFMQTDVFDWDYPEEQFDIVISQEVIEHVEDQNAYLGIAYRMLRRGGYLILTTPNARTLYAMPEEQRNSWSQQPIENWLNTSELENLLKDRFEIIRLTTIIPGYGVKGTYRLANSLRFKSFFEKAAGGCLFDDLRLGLGYGLHIFALTKKK